MDEHIQPAPVLAGRVEHVALFQQPQNHPGVALTGRLKAHSELYRLPLDVQAMQIVLILLGRPRDCRPAGCPRSGTREPGPERLSVL